MRTAVVTFPAARPGQICLLCPEDEKKHAAVEMHTGDEQIPLCLTCGRLPIATIQAQARHVRAQGVRRAS